MLPRQHKLTSSADFKAAMSKGVRAGSRTLVVHVRRREDLVTWGGPRFGLVVSKQVGNAVVRHGLSRRLRGVLGGVDKLERHYDVVVRALPAAAEATSDELARDFHHALDKAMAKL